eukprot:NODE_11_length_54881_cov_1.430718.p27 type:complete len:224 gc:universal NODE_11_length_54881_cov_1.430718:40592-41263(+)
MPPNQVDIPETDAIFFHNKSNRFVERKEQDVSWMRKSNQIQESRVNRESILDKLGKAKKEEKFVKDIKSVIASSFEAKVPSVHPKTKKKAKRVIPLHPYFQSFGPEYQQFTFPDGVDLDENEEERHLNTVILKPIKDHYGLFKCGPEHSEIMLKCREEDRDLANEIIYSKHRDYQSDKTDSNESKFLNIVVQDKHAYYIPVLKRNTMRKTRVFYFYLAFEARE